MRDNRHCSAIRKRRSCRNTKTRTNTVTDRQTVSAGKSGIGTSFEREGKESHTDNMSEGHDSAKNGSENAL